MNKSEMVKKISDKTGYTQTAVADVINAFMDLTIKSVKKGIPVQLVGFGSFSATKKAARTYKGFDGKKTKVPAHKAPKFTFGKAFKDAVK